MRSIFQSVIVASFIVTIVILIKLYLPLSVNTKGADVIVPLVSINKCHLLKSGCVFVAENVQVEINFSGNVHTMQSFKLLARIDGINEPIKEVAVDFSMPSMKMGFNHFLLIKNTAEAVAGNWQSSILLPVCVSKRTDWLMKFVIKTDNKIYQAVIPLQIN